MVPSAKGRKFACSKETKEGSRFVPMVCVKGDGQAPAPIPKSSPSSRAKRAAKLDWSKCKCPDGAEKKTSAKGRTQCIQKGPKGRAVFVKALCSPAGLTGVSRGRR